MIDCSKCIHNEVCAKKAAIEGLAGVCGFFKEELPMCESKELKPLVDKVIDILPELSDAIIEDLPEIISRKIKCSGCPYYNNTQSDR